MGDPVRSYDSVLAYWKAKKVASYSAFKTFSAEAKNQAFSTALNYSNNTLTSIAESLDKALREGKTVYEWKQDFGKILDQFGYDPKAVSPFRLNLLFRQNTINALTQGRYAEMFADDAQMKAPAWRFVAIHDKRTDDPCLKLDGAVFLKGDVVGRRFLPPLHFQCRCIAQSVPASVLKKEGIEISNAEDFLSKGITPDPGFDFDKAREVRSILKGASPAKAVLPSAFADVIHGLPKFAPETLLPTSPLTGAEVKAYWAEQAALEKVAVAKAAKAEKLSAAATKGAETKAWKKEALSQLKAAGLTDEEAKIGATWAAKKAEKDAALSKLVENKKASNLDVARKLLTAQGEELGLSPAGIDQLLGTYGIGPGGAGLSEAELSSILKVYEKAALAIKATEDATKIAAQEALAAAQAAGKKSAIYAKANETKAWQKTFIDQAVGSGLSKEGAKAEAIALAKTVKKLEALGGKMPELSLQELKTKAIENALKKEAANKAAAKELFAAAAPTPTDKAVQKISDALSKLKFEDDELVRAWVKAHPEQLLGDIVTDIKDLGVANLQKFEFRQSILTDLNSRGYQIEQRLAQLKTQFPALGGYSDDAVRVMIGDSLNVPGGLTTSNLNFGNFDAAFSAGEGKNAIGIKYGADLAKLEAAGQAGLEGAMEAAGFGGDAVLGISEKAKEILKAIPELQEPSFGGGAKLVQAYVEKFPGTQFAKAVEDLKAFKLHSDFYGYDDAMKMVKLGYKAVLPDAGEISALAPKLTVPGPGISAAAKKELGLSDPGTSFSTAGWKKQGTAKGLGGAFEKDFWQAPDGTVWLVKPETGTALLKSHADEVASKLGSIIRPEGTIEARIVTLPDGTKGSAQRFIAGMKSKVVSELTPDEIRSIQREQVLDWLIGNHDAHAKQFLFGDGGTVYGVDKSQAFKFYGKDLLSPTYHPNSQENAPIYNLLFERAKKGSLVLDPQAIEGTLLKARSIPDASLREIVRPYAEARFGKGIEAEKLLDQIVARKKAIVEDFSKLYSDALGKPVSFLKTEATPVQPFTKAVVKDASHPLTVTETKAWMKQEYEKQGLTYSQEWAPPKEGGFEKFYTEEKNGMKVSYKATGTDGKPHVYPGSPPPGLKGYPASFEDWKAGLAAEEQAKIAKAEHLAMLQKKTAQEAAALKEAQKAEAIALGATKAEAEAYSQTGGYENFAAYKKEQDAIKAAATLAEQKKIEQLAQVRASYQKRIFDANNAAEAAKPETRERLDAFAHLADTRYEHATRYRTLGEKYALDAEGRRYHVGRSGYGSSELGGLSYEKARDLYEVELKAAGYTSARSRAAMDSVHAYSGSTYGDLNAEMRRVRNFSQLSAKNKKIATGIADFLAKAPKMKRDVKLFRGFRLVAADVEGLTGGIESIKPGMVYRDFAFASASDSPSTARSFARNAVAEIRSHKSAVSVEGIAGGPSEQEAIFPHESRFRVIGFRKPTASERQFWTSKVEWILVLEEI